MARFYVVSDSGVDVFSNFNKVKQSIAIEKEEFTQVGGDYIVNMTDESYTISKDIRLLENVASKRVFTKSKWTSTEYLIIFVGFLTLLTYMKIGEVITIIGGAQ